MPDPSGGQLAYAKDSAVLQLSSVPAVESVTPDWAWGGATGAGVRVAVIDSGVEATHPAIGGRVDTATGVEVVLDDNDDPAFRRKGDHGDAFGHGTAVAGIIHSLAPEATIVSVKVLDAGLAGTADAFLRGLAWAVEEGFQVINLSLGTSRRDWALAFYELCDRAYFQNCFLVTAANNAPRPSFPSLYASVASVACNLSKDPFRFHYNPEPPTEFLARGINVDVAWRHGGSARMSGNSFAASHMSGIAALVRSKHPELRPFQVKSILWATAANVRQAGRREVMVPRSRSRARPSMRLSRALLVTTRPASAWVEARRQHHPRPG